MNLVRLSIAFSRLNGPISRLNSFQRLPAAEMGLPLWPKRDAIVKVGVTTISILRALGFDQPRSPQGLNVR